METPWSRDLENLIKSEINRAITLSVADKPTGGKGMLLSNSKQQGQGSYAKTIQKTIYNVITTVRNYERWRE